MKMLACKNSTGVPFNGKARAQKYPKGNNWVLDLFLLYCDSGTSNSNVLQINIMVQIKLMRDEFVIAYPGP